MQKNGNACFGMMKAKFLGKHDNVEYIRKMMKTYVGMILAHEAMGMPPMPSTETHNEDKP